MKYVTAMVGAALVFTGTGMAALFVATRLVEERSTTAHIIAIGSSVLVALIAAVSSCRASVRR
jgi:hypothetical protein